MPAADPSTPDPTYAMSASSNSPWIVPSSPKVPCSTGKTTSSPNPAVASSAAALSINGFTSPASVRVPAAPAAPAGTCGITTVRSPRRITSAVVVSSGSPASRGFAGPCSPLSRASASRAVTHRPAFVMPIGTTSYFTRSIARKIEAALSSETSCSPLRPPNNTPTRSRFPVVAIPPVSRKRLPFAYAFAYLRVTSAAICRRSPPRAGSRRRLDPQPAEDEEHREVKSSA